MFRKVAMALVAVLVIGSNAQAFELESETSTINNIGGTFTFDFTGDVDLSQLEPDSKLTGIQADWLFTPANGASSTLDLVADLFLPSDGGIESGIGFDLRVNQADGPTSSFSANIASSPLVFGPVIVSELVDGDFGVIDGVLNILGPDVLDLTEFLNGGTITGKVTLFFKDEDNGSGEVPEPASLLVWSGLAGMGMVYRRRKNKKGKITVDG